MCVCVRVCVRVCLRAQSSQRTAVEPRHHRSADWTLKGYSTNVIVRSGSQICLGQRSPLFWDITQRIMVIPYRRLGTTVRFHLQGLEDGTERLSLKMGSICLPKTSVRNCHYTPCNIPEERRSHLIRGWSQNSHIVRVAWNLQIKQQWNSISNTSACLAVSFQERFVSTHSFVTRVSLTQSCEGKF
jgi:hypothetical protein